MVVDKDSATMAELRGMARQIEDDRKFAEIRCSTFAVALLEESLSAFTLDREIVARIEKVRGERLHQLKQELFALFAKVAKSITEEVFEERVKALLARYATPQKEPRKQAQSKG